MANISILNGALVKFGVSFTVPVNANYNKIEFEDVIPNGLSYYDVAITDGAGNALVDGTDYTVDNTAAPSLKITITDPDILNPLTDEAEVNITLTTGVVDTTLLTTPSITNTATVTPYNSTNSALTPATDTAVVDWRNYELFIFGGADTISRRAGVPVTLLYFFPIFDGYSPYYDNTITNVPNFNYITTLTPNPKLGIDMTNIITDDQIQVYQKSLDGNLNLLDDTTGEFSYELVNSDQSVKVTIPHADELKNSELYVVLNTTTGTPIEATTEAQVLSSVVGNLVNAATGDVIRSASDDNVTTNITDTKEITVIKKTVL